MPATFRDPRPIRAIGGSYRFPTWVPPGPSGSHRRASPGLPCRRESGTVHGGGIELLDELSTGQALSGGFYLRVDGPQGVGGSAPTEPSMAPRVERTPNPGLRSVAPGGNEDVPDPVDRGIAGSAAVSME
jgi:hypothetical protein